MGGIGIVNNPRSGRNVRRPEVARGLRSLLRHDGELIDASTPEELARAVERFRAARIDVLGVNGGDGTGHHVLTTLVRAYGPDPLPALLLLRGGAMNTVAHGHGIRGGPERILRAVLARRRSGAPVREVERDLLRVEADGGAPRFGFIFGTGVMVTFLDAYYATGRPCVSAATLLIARALASALVDGRFAASLARRERLRVATDGEEWPDTSYLALAASSTPDIGLGFRAFQRCSEQPGFFQAVGVTGSVAQLALAAPRVRRGAPWRRRLAHDEVARELLVEGDRPRFTIDGDLYGAGRSVAVTTGPAIRLLLPW
jgi:diacylglycerol kinase family enzyme